MHPVINPPRIGATDADPVAGRVVYAPGKSLWLTFHTLGALIGGAATFSWDALLLFLVLTAAVLLFGHSLGMHRKLIHDSYDCPLWLEHLFVYCGMLVGMAGPYGMVRTHDIRDWAQRQARCHPYLADAGPALRDAWWQLHCDLELDHPPRLTMEPRIANDRFYQWLERTWRWHHLFWAALLYLWGGWAYVFWGACARVTAGVTGHWLVGWFAHNRGHRTYHVEGAAAQGYNVPIAALVTMGEAWHNNHHAYPGSARMGLYKGEADPGWWTLKLLETLGLVWNLRLPADLPQRPELKLLPPPVAPVPGIAREALTPESRRRANQPLTTLFFLYMMPFSLLYLLGLLVWPTVVLLAAYGPPFLALWAAALAYFDFRKGVAPFALHTVRGKLMIILLAYGVLASLLSTMLCFALPNGDLNLLRGICTFAGIPSLPAALFASLVLLKVWKERNHATLPPAGAA